MNDRRTVTFLCISAACWAPSQYKVKKPLLNHDTGQWPLPCTSTAGPPAAFCCWWISQYMHNSTRGKSKDLRVKFRASTITAFDLIVLCIIFYGILPSLVTDVLMVCSLPCCLTVNLWPLLASTQGDLGGILARLSSHETATSQIQLSATTSSISTSAFPPSFLLPYQLRQISTSLRALNCL